MIRALALLLFLAVAAPEPLWAAGAEKKEQADGARAVDVVNLMAPVVREGRLVNYVFITARIQLSPGADVWRAREQGHFLRDALLKAVHRQSIVDSTRDDAVNPAATQSLITETARQVLGANAVRSVEIRSVSSLRQGSPPRS